MPASVARFRLVLHWPKDAGDALIEAVTIARQAADAGRPPHPDILLRLPPKTRGVVRGLALEGEDFGLAAAWRRNGDAAHLVLADDDGRFCPKPTADLLAAVMRDYGLVGSIAATWSERDESCANGAYETGGGLIVTANVRKIVHLDDVLRTLRAEIDPDFRLEEETSPAPHP